MDTIPQKLSNKNTTILAMSAAGLSGKQIAQKLGTSEQNVSQHLQRSRAYLQKYDPDSPILKAQQELDNYLPQAVQAVKDTIEQNSNESLRYQASKDLLQGRQVYVKRTEEHKEEHKTELQIKAELAARENKLIDLYNLDKEPVEVDYELVDEPETPPPAGDKPRGDDGNR